MIAHGALEHRVFLLQRIKHGTDRRRTIQLKLNFLTDAGEGAEVMRQDDANHLLKFESRSSKPGTIFKIRKSNVPNERLPVSNISSSSVIRICFEFRASDFEISYFSVCTSTDSTAGKSLTIARQVSPESREA